MIFPEDLTRSLLDALSIHEAILRQDPGRNASELIKFGTLVVTYNSEKPKTARSCVQSASRTRVGDVQYVYVFFLLNDSKNAENITPSFCRSPIDLGTTRSPPLASRLASPHNSDHRWL